MAQKIVARPKFQVDEVHRSYEIYKSTRMDSICHIKREFVNYYLFAGVENPILVTNNSTWIPHPFVALSENRRFKILAESEDKYQIVELGNILGLMFEFNTENHNHRWLVRNYVRRMIDKLRSSGYRPKRLMDMMQNDRKQFESVQDETIKTMYEEYVQRLKAEISKSKDLEGISKIPHELDVFKHSGMACRKHTLLRTVNQNSINKAEEYAKHEMSGFHDPFLGDTERENRRWNNKQFREKHISKMVQKYVPGSRNKSTTRAATSSSATSSEKMRQLNSRAENSTSTRGNNRNAKDSRSTSHSRQMNMEEQAENDKQKEAENLDPQHLPHRVQSFRESQKIERMYQQRAEDFVNPPKITGIDDPSSFARLKRFASKESVDEDDPSLAAAQSEGTFFPYGPNRTVRTQGSSSINPKGATGTKVLYRMRADELNLILPKVDTGVRSRSVSREHLAEENSETRVVNSVLMSKSNSKPLNALIKIVQVADPDDKTTNHIKRRKLRMDSEEERLTRHNKTFKY